jgi:hypothetical protein
MILLLLLLNYELRVARHRQVLKYNPCQPGQYTPATQANMYRHHKGLHHHHHHHHPCNKDHSSSSSGSSSQVGYSATCP